MADGPDRAAGDTRHDDADDHDDHDSAVGPGEITAADRPAPPSPKVPVPDEHQGQSIIVASWVGTVVFSVLAVVATVSLESVQTAFVVVSCLLVVVGFVTALLAYLIAILRSREDAIGMGGLFFLVGSAPRRVQVHLLVSLAIEVVVSLVTASIGFAIVPTDQNNVLAIGTLVPLYGLGLAGLWGARHGRFGPRPAPTAARGSEGAEAPDPTG